MNNNKKNNLTECFYNINDKKKLKHVNIYITYFTEDLNNVNFIQTYITGTIV